MAGWNKCQQKFDWMLLVASETDVCQSYRAIHALDFFARFLHFHVMHPNAWYSMAGIHWYRLSIVTIYGEFILSHRCMLDFTLSRLSRKKIHEIKRHKTTQTNRSFARQLHHKCQWKSLFRLHANDEVRHEQRWVLDSKPITQMEIALSSAAISGRLIYFFHSFAVK